MRKNAGIKILVLSVLFLFSPLAMAQGAGSSGWVLKPSVMYLYQSFNDNGSKTDVTRELVDLSLGYQFSSPLYLGAIYSYEQDATSNAAGTTKDTYTAYGPSLGLVTENLYMIFSYFLSATDQHDPNTTYSGGSGFEATLGYKFGIGSSVAVAPEIAFRSLAFTKVNSGGGDTTTDYKYSTLVPYVAFWFYL